MNAKRVIMKSIVVAVLVTALICTAIIGANGAISPQSETAYAASKVWDGTTATSFAGGSGTSADPYKIASAEQLALLMGIINANDGTAGTVYPGTSYVIANMRTAHYKLTDDIALNDEHFTFEPDTGLIEITDGINTAYIGTCIKGDDSGDNTMFDSTASNNVFYDSSRLNRYYTLAEAYRGTVNIWSGIGKYDYYNSVTIAFAGVFDGNGHTVSGIYKNTNDNNLGLFGLIEGVDESHKTEVKNVGVIDSFISGKSSIGGIVGSNRKNSTITNCYNSGFVITKSGDAGGIVGFHGTTSNEDNHITITNCYNSGLISSYGNGNGIAGIAGCDNGLIEDCYNLGTVVGTSSIDNNIGGIAGISVGSATNLSVVIRNCFNLGKIINTYAGRNEAIDIGGIVGCAYHHMNVINCYNFGEVSGSSNVGGIAGYVGYTNNIYNCYNKGSISSISGHVGGILGYTDGASNFANLYNSGTVSGGSNFIGSISGAVAVGPTFTNCYYLEGTAINSRSVIQNGIGLYSSSSSEPDINGETNSFTENGRINATSDITITKESDTETDYIVSNGDTLLSALNGWITTKSTATNYTTWGTDGYFARLIDSVVFDANGGEFSDHSVEKSYEIADGSVTIPSSPNWKSYVFAGWYEDKNFTTEFNNSNIVYGKTVYAKWTNGGKIVRNEELLFTSSTLSVDKSASYGYKWELVDSYNDANSVTDVNCIGILTLSGLTLDTKDYTALGLPNGAIIKLNANSVNTVIGGDSNLAETFSA